MKEIKWITFMFFWLFSYYLIIATFFELIYFNIKKLVS